jgi:hypothetical protein
VIAGRLFRPIVVDGRNVLDRSALSALGITYRSIGRSLRAVSLPAAAEPLHKVAK